MKRLNVGLSLAAKRKQSVYRFKLECIGDKTSGMAHTQDNAYSKINRLVLSGAMLCFLGACTAAQPFVDSRREAGQRDTVGQSTTDVIAVCYNKFISDRSQTYDLAEAECQKSRRHAVYESYTDFTCSLIASGTVFYRCVK